jgi:hypothetical protein
MPPAPRRPNPFPVDHFVGREAEIADIEALVTATLAQSAAVLGEPRIGKTWLLRHLASPEKLGGRSELLVAYVDAQRFDAGFDRARFWIAVLGPLEEEGRFAPADAPPAVAYRACRAEAFSTESVERLLRALGKSGVRLVVIIDELDYLVHRHLTTRDDFFIGLRSLVNGTHRALSLVVSSREQLAALEDVWRAKGAGGSPPFNVYTQILLGPLGETEIDALLDVAGAGFSLDDRRFVHDVSGGYAALVQHAASSLFVADAADPAGRRRQAGGALLPEVSRMFAHIWSQWTPAARHVFTTVALEHLGALGPRIGWEQGPVSLVDAASYPEEIHALGRHGFIAASPCTPSGYVVLPLLFLTWLAVRLRQSARSPEQWSRWMDLEGWSGDRRSFLETTVRPRAATIRTDLETLVHANATLSGRPLSKRVPPVVATQILPSSLVLHLSDLHFGTREDAEIWYGQLAEDLHELGCAQIDAAILSGDIADRSSAAEYEAAALFLEKTARRIPDRAGPDHPRPGEP